MTCDLDEKEIFKKHLETLQNITQPNILSYVRDISFSLLFYINFQKTLAFYTFMYYNIVTLKRRYTLGKAKVIKMLTREELKMAHNNIITIMENRVMQMTGCNRRTANLVTNEILDLDRDADRLLNEKEAD